MASLPNIVFRSVHKVKVFGILYVEYCCCKPFEVLREHTVYYPGEQFSGYRGILQQNIDLTRGPSRRHHCTFWKTSSEDNVLMKKNKKERLFITLVLVVGFGYQFAGFRYQLFVMHHFFV